MLKETQTETHKSIFFTHTNQNVTSNRRTESTFWCGSLETKKLSLVCLQGTDTSSTIFLQQHYNYNSGLWSPRLWTQFKPQKFRTSTGFEPVTSRYRCDALTNWAMKPLTLGAGHLWVLMSPWRMDVKWYMKCFIYWTADFEICIYWTADFKIRSSIYETFHISLHYNYSIPGFISDCCLMLPRFF